MPFRCMVQMSVYFNFKRKTNLRKEKNIIERKIKLEGYVACLHAPIVKKIVEEEGKREREREKNSLLINNICY